MTRQTRPWAIGLICMGLGACSGAPTAAPEPEAPAAVDVQAPAAPSAFAAFDAACPKIEAALGNGGHLLVGETGGVECAETARMTLLGPGGADILVSETYGQAALRVIFGEASGTDVAGLDGAQAAQARLAEWMSSALRGSIGDLPDWPEGATEPEPREFPFLPDEGLSAEDYRRLRAANAPMACWVQGGESARCVAIDPASGAAVELGVQTFPG